MKVRKNILVFAVLALSVSFLSGCMGTVKVQDRPDGVMPLPADKFVIMPVDLHMPGDNDKLSAALFTGLSAGFSDKGLSLQPFKPALEAVGLHNLSWDLAHGMHHMVSFHNSYDFKEDARHHGGNSELVMLIEGVGKVVGFAAKKLDLDFKPKWIVTAHVDSLGAGTLPKTLNYRAFIGLYNLETSKVERVLYFEETTADTPEAVMASMSALGGKLHSELMAAK